MNARTRTALPRALLSLLLLAPLAWPAAACRADDASDEAVRVRAVLICNTKDRNIGDSVEADLKNVRSLLEDGFRARFGAKYKDHLDLVTLAGERFTRQEVLDYFKNLQTGPSETLLVYYSGHGGYFPAEGQAFGMDGNNLLLRSDLVRVMLEKHARLSVLLSDACNEYPDKSEFEAAPRAPAWETLRDLLLRPRGLVDVNSVSEGEFAFGQASGGYFTETLADLLRQDFGKLATNKDGLLTWDELVPRLQTGAQARYAKLRTEALKGLNLSPSDRAVLRKQEYQTVRVYALPPLFRFGARVLDHDGGAQVLLVHDYTPAALAGVKPGDVITAVGGRKVRGADDLYQALARSKGVVEVEVVRGPAVKTLKVSLAPWLPRGREG
ncbi:MAG TPA: PDZ domain-containing protein [Gemmataceae bacterium]|nr:PDZ domain-containing protein [Gemmataceae bacterium]